MPERACLWVTGNNADFIEGTILWISWLIDGYEMQWPAVPGWPGPVDGLCIEVSCRKLSETGAELTSQNVS